MLETLTHWSRRIAFMRPVFLVVSLVSAGLFAVELLTDIGGYPKDYWLMPAGAALLWSFFFWLFTTGFGKAPAAPDATDGLWQGLKMRLARVYFTLLAVLLGASFLGALLVTLRFVRVWGDKY